MLSRREMGALCAALLLCLLLSLGAGWAKGQLDAADALAADTLRLHIRPTPTQCGTRARAGRPGCRAGPRRRELPSGR